MTFRHNLNNDSIGYIYKRPFNLLTNDYNRVQSLIEENGETNRSKSLIVRVYMPVKPTYFGFRLLKT